MDKPTTIEDIAQQAGVSVSTVSRVLNGSTRVSASKRALVLAVIERLQYRPSAVAQGLARGRSMTVGVLVQNITSSFFGLMLWGCEEALEQHAYRPMFASTHWRENSSSDEQHALDLLLSRRVDGLIILGGRIGQSQLQPIAEQLPVIVVGRQVPGFESSCLTVDNHEGAYRATRYLIGLGHTRIAHITGTPTHGDAIERVQGYRRALEESNIPLDPELIVEGQFTEDSGRSAVEQLLGRGAHFTALFASNDQMAYGAMLTLFTHGFHIPDDISVVGFDDQLHSAYTLPPLTTVRVPITEIGRAAAHTLIRRIEGEEAALPQFHTELTIRASARRLRGDAAH